MCYVYVPDGLFDASVIAVDIAGAVVFVVVIIVDLVGPVNVAGVVSCLPSRIVDTSLPT